jgi:hypothetical protein
MANCYHCPAKNILATDEGTCPACNILIIYPCWRCHRKIIVRDLIKKGIRACSMCHFYECPWCEAHGQPCNSDAPLSDWQKQQILNNQPLTPEQIKKNQEWWDQEQERI